MTNARHARLSLVARLGEGLSPSASRVVANAGCHVQGARGQTGAVDDLVAAHADAVYRYALRLTRNSTDAQDLMQETLLRGWKDRRKLREPAAARVWLLKIATNVHHDWLRGTRGARFEASLVAEPVAPLAPAPRRLEQRECIERALMALDELPPRQRQAMHLVTIEQLAHEDAATVLGISVDALKSSLSQGRRTMREKLQDIYDDIRGVRTI